MGKLAGGFGKWGVLSGYLQHSELKMVTDLSVAVCGEYNILWFEITVDDAS